MKKALLIVMILAVASVVYFLFKGGKPKANAILTAENLQSSFYEIDIERDTTIVTSAGSIIKIPAGSVVAGNSKVKVEIKEAITIEDIVKAGLTTTSDGRMLRSGGMIYVNVTDKNAVMKGQWDVKLPAETYEPGMTLFKGNVDNDGKINWKDVDSLKESDYEKKLAQGKQLFESNCSSCHDPFKDATGPALLYMKSRRDWGWLKAFTRNPSALIASGDPLANCVYNQWNKTAMTAFPNLTDSELEDLYDYLEVQSKSIAPNNVADAKLCVDSCLRYKSALKGSTQLLEQKSDFLEDNGRQVIDQMATDESAPEGTKVEIINNRAIYYQFTISSFGWYNIDQYVANNADAVQSKLIVSVDGGNSEMPVNVYLIIPDKKIVNAAGILDDGNYGFFEQDGRLPLPQGYEAFILAIGERNGEILYGTTTFTTNQDQHLKVSVDEIAQAEFKIAISKLNFDSLSIVTAASKNADSIRSIDVQLNEIEKLKPTSCDCDCLDPYYHEPAIWNDGDSVRY